jgi:hypothetical protein
MTSNFKDEGGRMKDDLLLPLKDEGHRGYFPKAARK